MSEIPDTLYKYSAAKYVIETLRNERIKVTPPAELNDPFEFSPPFDGELNRKTFPPAFFKLNESKLMADCSTLPRRERRRKRQEILGRIQQDAGAIFVSYKQGIKEQLTELNRSRAAVLCMSSRNDGILLWAHYGESHQGAVLGFDTSERKNARTGFFAVEYSSTRPRVDVAKILHERRVGAEMLKIAICSKSVEWQYEGEYRLILGRHGLEEVSRGGDSPLLFMRIAPRLFRTVVLGSRCSSENEQSIRELLSTPRFQHVTLLRAVLCSDNFRILTEPA